MTIHAYAANSAKEALKPFDYEPAELTSYEAQVKVTHCGVCHSDLHLIDNDWGFSSFPMVAGHEAVGVVTAVGATSKVKVGDRVGLGWQRASCQNCEYCDTAQQHLCAGNQPTCVGAHGGFADGVVADSRFLVHIPDAIESENAGPLFCGGITVYSPMKVYGVKPEMKVGVIGIGGLGHLALQFAKAWGCEVTAFSSSPDKEEEARSFGAHNYVNSRDADQLQAQAGKLDFIINTAMADLDWSAYLACLKPNGTLCFVGVPPSPIAVPAFGLIGGQRRIVGGQIGAPTDIKAMLDFCARHNVRAKIETVPLANVNDALDKVRNNKARYRMVLEMPK